MFFFFNKDVVIETQNKEYYFFHAHRRAFQIADLIRQARLLRNY
jgi:hypothetical protein